MLLEIVKARGMKRQDISFDLRMDIRFYVGFV